MKLKVISYFDQRHMVMNVSSIPRFFHQTNFNDRYVGGVLWSNDLNFTNNWRNMKVCELKFLMKDRLI